MAIKREVTEYQILIACPNDVKDDIEVIKSVISEFNNRGREVTFQPKHWQYDVPMNAGKPTQEIINETIVDNSDIVIAVFGRILGEGTLEEITKSIVDKKRTWVFFADKDFKLDEADEAVKLKKFKDNFKKSGVFSQYKDESDLRVQIQRQLELFLDSPPSLEESKITMPIEKNKENPLVIVFGAYGESRLKILNAIEALNPNEFKFIKKYTDKEMSDLEYKKMNLIYAPDEIAKCKYRYAYMGSGYGIKKDEINEVLNSNQIPIILVCGDYAVKQLPKDFKNSMLVYIHCFTEEQEEMVDDGNGKMTQLSIKNRKQGLVKLAAEMFENGELDTFLTYDADIDEDTLPQKLIDKIRSYHSKK